MRGRRQTLARQTAPTPLYHLTASALEGLTGPVVSRRLGPRRPCLDAIGVELSVVTMASVLAATSQSTATLIAAVIAALASVATLGAQLARWWHGRKRRNRLTQLLKEGDAIRSLEWLGRRVGMSEMEVAAMLPDIKAHGVKMGDNKEGAAPDSRHQGR